MHYFSQVQHASSTTLHPEMYCVQMNIRRTDMAMHLSGRIAVGDELILIDGFDVTNDLQLFERRASSGASDSLGVYACVCGCMWIYYGVFKYTDAMRSSCIYSSRPSLGNCFSCYC